MMSPLISLQKLHKSYRMGNITVHALRDVNLQVGRAEYLAILGPSGSGKSTLMNILGCLDSPTDGNYYLDGRDVSQLQRDELAVIRNQRIGFIFQSFNLLETMNALDNVALPLIYRGLHAAKRNELAKKFLTDMGLAHRMHHKPSELSGGQRQRVAIARALATNPDVILADEPTGNLDSRSGEDVVQLFEALVAVGKTVIIVTHDLVLAQHTRRIVYIRDGVIESDNKVPK